MPDGSSPLLISLIILILCSGFFSATETAYSCVSKIKLKTLFTNGNRLAGKVLEFSESKYDRLLSTILIGNNIVNISASAIATVFFAKILLNSKIDSTVVATAVVTVAVLIFGEITPKYIAKAYPEKISMLFYPVIKTVYYILIPLSFVFIGWKNLISKIFRLDRQEVITEEEIITFVEEAEDDGTIRKDETNLIRSVIDFDDLEVREVLTPRVKITAVSTESSFEEIKKVFKESRFSRLPVYKDSLDLIVGILHLKDFYGSHKDSFSIKESMQKAFYIPEHTKLSKLLKTFQKERMQMAVVLDEYGGTMGIVTLEDILEELVGEIWDEHDIEIPEYQKLSDGSFIFMGNTPLDKVLSLTGAEDADISHESNTLSGWLLEIFDEIPVAGQKIEASGIHAEVLESDEKTISKVKISYTPEVVYS